MHDLEVIEIAVGLIEVAVTVKVVTVVLVISRQCRLDLCIGLASSLLLFDPGLERILDEIPRALVCATVTRLVIGNLHPVRHLTVDRVAAR